MIPFLICGALAAAGLWLNLPLHPDSRLRWIGYGLTGLALGALLGWLASTPTAVPLRHAALIVLGAVAVVGAGGTIVLEDPQRSIRAFLASSLAVSGVLGVVGAIVPAVLILAVMVPVAAVVRRCGSDPGVAKTPIVYEPFLACATGACLAAGLSFAIGEQFERPARGAATAHSVPYPAPALITSVQQRLSAQRSEKLGERRDAFVASRVAIMAILLAAMAATLTGGFQSKPSRSERATDSHAAVKDEDAGDHRSGGPADF